MRLTVDWTRCDGRGLCAELAPEAIGEDDWGYPVLPAGDVPSDALDWCRRAVAACPRQALRLEGA